MKNVLKNITDKKKERIRILKKEFLENKLLKDIGKIK